MSNIEFVNEYIEPVFFRLKINALFFLVTSLLMLMLQYDLTRKVAKAISIDVAFRPPNLSEVYLHPFHNVQLHSLL